MDSRNWRVKREPKDEGTGPRSPDGFPSHLWGRTSGGSETNQPGSSSFSSWGALPAYKESQPPYRGGLNPRRGRFSQPLLRPHTITKDPQADDAITQNQRIYVGNLPYDAKVNDIRGLFADISYQIKDISMSIDPMTGRNPSYCFVDFTTKEAAEKTIQHYNGLSFMGRPLKVNLSVKPGTGTGRYHLKHNNQSTDPAVKIQPPAQELPQKDNENPYAFDRWRRHDDKIEPDILNHTALEEERRLRVGGLPRFFDQPTTNLKIRELFKGYNIEVVSKLRSPHKTIKKDPGNNYQCYVDLATKEEADEAAAALNGIEMWNWTITVTKWEKVSTKLHERERVYISNLPRSFDDRTLINEVKCLLEPFGVLQFISHITNNRAMSEKQQSTRCYCYVEFAEGQQADAAIRTLGQTAQVKGRRVTLKAPNQRGALEEHFSKTE